MKPIVECVPNFSEGRNPAVVNALTAAVRAVKGVALLDQHMDADHHRSVLTFAGPPALVGQAAFEAVRTAIGLIDLKSHSGQHPRVGAADVVPFSPLRESTMDPCIELAQYVGARIGSELKVPVFLYERACSEPDRATLEAIRRGGLEGLGTRMRIDPRWVPDYGPCALQPTAGAIAVGARPPLIAFNVILETTDLSIAQAIAKKIRSLEGGLPSVKALGFELRGRGQVQVSMNLTNFRETPLHTAYEAVKREAEQRGVSISGSELVGLIPQEALTETASHDLQLGRLASDQVLEKRMNLGEEL